MIMPIAMLIVCSFVGGNDYDCSPSETFETFEACEEVALNLAEAKGIHSYCIEIDDVSY